VPVAAILRPEQVTFRWNDDDNACFVLDQHDYISLHSVSSLKQKFVGRIASPLEHIILIPSKSVFDLTP